MSTEQFFKQKDINDFKFDKNRVNELLTNYNELSAVERNELVSRNMGLVAKIVSSYYNKCSDKNVDLLDELLSIGFYGLQKGINTFDVNRQYSFSTYASTCIKNEIKLYLKKRNIWKIKETSFDIKTDSGETISLLDTIGCSSPTPHEQVLENEKINILLGSLKPEDKLFLMKRYGIFGYDKVKQRELAKELNIGRTGVSAKQKKLVKKLGKIARLMYLKDNS